MRTEQFTQWVSLVANLGVLVGLVFLVIEISQTNSLMESEERYNRAVIALSGPDLLIENPLLVTAIRKRNNSEELSEDERILLNAYYSGNFIAWQWSWEELDESDMPIVAYLDQLEREDVYVQWQTQKIFLKPEFVAFIEEKMVAD